MAVKKKKTGAVSQEVAEILDHIAGIPKGKEKEAREAQRSIDTKSARGEEVYGEGMWFGGCYYVRVYYSSGGTAKPYWQLLYCLA